MAASRYSQNKSAAISSGRLLYTVAIACIMMAVGVEADTSITVCMCVYVCMRVCVIYGVCVTTVSVTFALELKVRTICVTFLVQNSPSP